MKTPLAACVLLATSCVSGAGGTYRPMSAPERVHLSSPDEVGSYSSTLGLPELRELVRADLQQAEGGLSLQRLEALAQRVQQERDAIETAEFFEQLELPQEFARLGAHGQLRELTSLLGGLDEQAQAQRDKQARELAHLQRERAEALAKADRERREVIERRVSSVMGLLERGEYVEAKRAAAPGVVPNPLGASGVALHELAQGLELIDQAVEDPESPDDELLSRAASHLEGSRLLLAKESRGELLIEALTLTSRTYEQVGLEDEASFALLHASDIPEWEGLPDLYRGELQRKLERWFGPTGGPVEATDIPAQPAFGEERLSFDQPVAATPEAQLLDASANRERTATNAFPLLRVSPESWGDTSRPPSQALNLPVLARQAGGSAQTWFNRIADAMRRLMKAGGAGDAQR